MKHLVLCLFLMLSLACSVCSFTEGGEKKKTFYDASIKVDFNNVPLDSQQFYFPLIGKKDSMTPSNLLIPGGEVRKEIVEFYKDPSRIDSFCNAWFSQHLFRMKEPLLFNKSLDSDIIRVTWLRSFHNPIVITLEKKKGQYTLHWKRCDGMGGYDPGTLVEDSGKIVDRGVWDELNRKQQEANFWKEEYRIESIGNDGAECIVEAAGPDYYWVKRKRGITPVGRYMLSLADVKVSKGDIY